MKHLFTQFSFPGSIPNHVAPETPDSIHECVGWATLSRTPTAWHSTIPVWLWLVSLATAKRGHGPLATRAFQQVSEPATDGVVLPTLLNGHKSANPYVLVSRSLMVTPGISSKGATRKKMHEILAATLDGVLDN